MKNKYNYLERKMVVELDSCQWCLWKVTFKLRPEDRSQHGKNRKTLPREWPVQSLGRRELDMLYAMIWL